MDILNLYISLSSNCIFLQISIFNDNALLMALLDLRTKTSCLRQGKDLLPETQVETSREKYAELLPQTWQETSQCLVKNTLFCRHKHSWKCPDLPFKIPIFVSTNTTGNIPKPYQKLSFCHHVHGLKCPTVLLKNPLFVSTNTDGNVLKSCWKHSVFSQQTCLEMFQHLIKSIQWFHT